MSSNVFCRRIFARILWAYSLNCIARIQYKVFQINNLYPQSHIGVLFEQASFKGEENHVIISFPKSEQVLPI